MNKKERDIQKEIQRDYSSGAYAEIEAELQKELKGMIGAFGVGYNLQLHFRPSIVKRRQDGKTVYLFGEVVDDTICVYRWTGLEDAKQTLVHEFFEFLICSVQEHRDLASNAIVEELMSSLKRFVETYGRVISEITYQEKERIIDTLAAGWLKKQR